MLARAGPGRHSGPALPLQRCGCPTCPCTGDDHGGLQRQATGDDSSAQETPAEPATCAGGLIDVAPLEVEEDEEAAPTAVGAAQLQRDAKKTKPKKAGGAGAPTAACPVPADFGVFANKPGGDGSGKAAATATGLGGFKGGSFVVTFDPSTSWVDTNIVTKAKKRSGNTTNQVAACTAAFAAGNTWFQSTGQTTCPAAPNNPRKASKTDECESVIGAGLDADGIADEPRLLAHEQYHVKLVCAAASKAAATLPAGTTKVTKTVKAVYDALGAVMQPNSDAYDKATSNGCIPAQQAQWEKDIDAGNVKIAPRAPASST